MSDFEAACQNTEPSNLTRALSRLTHYAVLQVQPKATQAQIKESYRELAKRFHPDKVADKKDKARHEIIIARVIEAYSILSNASCRENYDRKLQRMGARFADGSSKNGRSGSGQKKVMMQQAAILLKKGRHFRTINDPWNAVCHLKNALKLQPDNPDIHFELGLAMKKNLKWRRDVEHSFRSAIRLDPWRSEFYVALGDFYCEQGLSVRAGREYKRAVWLDPENDKARRKLDELLIGNKPKSPLGALRRILFNGKKGPVPA